MLTWARGGPGGKTPLAAIGPAKTPKIVWDVDLGATVFARAAIVTTDAGSIAYVGTHGANLVGVSVDGADAGKRVFDMTLGGMIWGTAATDARGYLYVGADDDTLYAIDPQQKKVLWKFAVGACKPSKAPGPEGARCDADGGPTLAADGDLYLGADGVYRIGVDGKQRWHFPADPTQLAKHVFSTPMVTSDGRVYFGGQDGLFTALASDGSMRWQYNVRADVDGSPALGIDGTILVAADDGRVHAVRDDGSLRWSFVTQKDIRSAVAVAGDGTIYVTSFDGNLYALTPDGHVRWVLPTGGRIMSSPIVDAAGNVFFGSQDDRLYAVAPQGRVLWSVQFPDDVDGSVALSPEGTLVVGCDDGHLRGLR